MINKVKAVILNRLDHYRDEANSGSIFGFNRVEELQLNKKDFP